MTHMQLQLIECSLQIKSITYHLRIVLITMDTM